jgi:hypothetical protein
LCQEHGIFKLFITRSFFELFLPFLMFECFTLLIFTPIIQNTHNAQSIHREPEQHGYTKCYQRPVRSRLYLQRASKSSAVHPGDRRTGPSLQGSLRTWRPHPPHSTERLVQADTKRCLCRDRSVSQMSPNCGTPGPTSPSPGDCLAALSM